MLAVHEGRGYLHGLVGQQQLVGEVVVVRRGSGVADLAHAVDAACLFREHREHLVPVCCVRIPSDYRAAHALVDRTRALVHILGEEAKADLVDLGPFPEERTETLTVGLGAPVKTGTALEAGGVGVL